MSRRAIILTKLLSGALLLLACTSLPILIYAAWAAAPGTHPAPFEWSMTGPMRSNLAGDAAVLPGAFASGIRPARWFGSRLLPLVAVAIPTFLLAVLPAMVADRACRCSCFATAVMISNILVEAGEAGFLSGRHHFARRRTAYPYCVGQQGSMPSSFSARNAQYG